MTGVKWLLEDQVRAFLPSRRLYYYIATMECHCVIVCSGRLGMEVLLYNDF